MVKYFNFTLALLPLTCLAQADSLTMEQAVQSALANNMHVKAASQHVQYQQHIKKTAGELPKTEVNLTYGQFNSIVKDNNLTFTQAIPFPTVFASRNAYHKVLVETSKAQLRNVENELAYQVKTLCFQAYYLYGKKRILIQQDSLYRVLRDVTTRRFQTGEENKLEVTKATARLKEIENAMLQVDADIKIVESGIQASLNNPSPVHIKDSQNKMPEVPLLDSAKSETNPGVQVTKYQFEAADKLQKVERSKILPEFRIGYFTQTLVGIQNVNGQDQFFGKDKRFNGIQFGIGIPLWFLPHASQVKAYSYASRQAASELKQTKIDWWAQLQKAHQQALKERASLEYYQTSGLPLAAQIQQQSLMAYRQGEISMTELLLNTNQSLNIQESYLKTLRDYNQSIINIEFLIGEKS